MNLTVICILTLFAAFGFDYFISTHIKNFYIEMINFWLSKVSLPMKLILIPLFIVSETLAVILLCKDFTDGKKRPDQFDISMAFILIRLIIEVHIIRAMTGFLM